MSDNVWKNLKNSLFEKDGVKPWDILNPNENKVDKETHKERYTSCLSCLEFIHETKVCKQCGCFMKIKTKLTDASCPLGKW
jgi:hypothetical protein